MAIVSATANVRITATAVGVSPVFEVFPDAVRVEINRSEPTVVGELESVTNGARSSYILDSAGDYLYSIFHEVDEDASGTIAHDATTTSSTFTTTDPFTFSHTAAAGTKGIILFVFGLDDTPAFVAEVTYGGLRMRGAGGSFTNGTGTQSFLLFGTVPSGAQTVSINHSGGAFTKQAVCASMTADRDLELFSGVTGSILSNPSVSIGSDRESLRYCFVFSTHDDPATFTPISSQTELSTIDFGTEVVRVYRRTNVETGVNPIGFASIAPGETIHFSAYSIQEVGEVSHLEIYDVSDSESPALIGTVSAMENLVTNKASHGMAMSTDGDSLYVLGSIGTLYALDISTRTAPSLVDTQIGVGNNIEYGHTVHVIGDELFRASGNPAVFGGGQVDRFDITTPGSPNLSESFSATIGSTSFNPGLTPTPFGYGYVTPDSKFIYYPNSENFFPSSGIPGRITIIDISSPMSEVVVDIPDTDDGDSTVEPIGVAFLPNPSSLSDRFLTLLCRRAIFGEVLPTGEYLYFWMTYQTASAGEWDNVSLYSHDESAGLTSEMSISTSRLAIGSAAGRLLVSDKRILSRLSRAERGEGYVYVYLSDDGDDSEKGRLTVWEFTNQGLDIDSAVGRTTPRLLSSIEVGELHDLGELVLAGSTLIGIGGNTGLASRSLFTMAPPTGWTELPTVQNRPGIEITYGISGSGPTDRLASSGTMTFELDNSEHSSQGALGTFSPDNANLFAGFRVGREIRLAVDWDKATHYPWWGTVETILPTPGRKFERRVRVTCVDFMDYLSRARIRGLDVQFNESAAQGIHLLLNRAQSDPVGVYYLNESAEFDIYPTLFDSGKDEKTSIVTEIQKLLQSERAFVYVVGGMLYFEGRSVRPDAFDLGASLVLTEGELMGLVPDHSARNLINNVEARVHPRRFDSSAVVLFNYDNTQAIVSGETVQFNAPYRDVDQKAQRVGGFNMVTPVASTDYTFNAAEDGTGADRTPQLDVSVTFGGNSAEVKIRNRGPSDGYLTLFRLRGQGIYTYEPVTVEKKSAQNEAQYGPLQLVYELPYHTSTPIAEDAAQYILRRYGDPRTFIESAHFWANRRSTLLDFVLKTRVVGSLLTVSEPVTGLSGESYFVQGARVAFREKGFVYANLNLAPADTESIFEVGDGLGGGSSLDGDDVLGSSFVA